MASVHLLSPFHAPEDAFRQWIYSPNPWLRMWGQWDSGWYLNIVRLGYPSLHSLDLHGVSNFGFFPFYPMLVSGFNWLIGNDFVAGLLLSNTFLLFASRYLYLLVVTEDGSERGKEKALQSVKYLFLFPTSFILSGFNPESLLLLLSFAILYYTRKQRWWLVGLLGFCIVLTKPLGVLILFPVVWIYLLQGWLNIKHILRTFIPLLLFPVGLILFCSFCYQRTGDFFAYYHTQQWAWNHTLMNPLLVLKNAIFSKTDFNAVVDGWFAVIALIALLLGWRSPLKMYILYGVLLILFILTNGQVYGIPRYLCTVFPLVIVLGEKLKASSMADQVISLSLSLLQGVFFVFWINGFWVIS